MAQPRFHDDVPRDPRFLVRVNGKPIDVLATDGDAFCTVLFDGPTEIEMCCLSGNDAAVIRPRRVAAQSERSDGWIRVCLSKPQDFMLDGYPKGSLFVYVSEHIPEPDQATRVFRSGEYYRESTLKIAENESIYLEPGAYVEAIVRGTEAHHSSLSGFGVISGQRNGGDAERLLVLDRSHDVQVRDVILIRPTTWMLVISRCSHVAISNVREIGHVLSSDGIDIVGSTHVVVRDCTLRNGDDCIVIKSFRHETQAYNVEDVLAERCLLFNDKGGSAMEIGFELQCDTVRNITFRDIDVLSVHGFGSVFGIHNGDGAAISNVVYEDIRVEHHYDRLISFRIVESRWSKDSKRGHISNITLENISVDKSIYNPGYTHSLIGGYDDRHTVDGVTIQNMVYGAKTVQRIEDIDLYLRHVNAFTIRS